jgi:thiol:disulfide interchange protein/DsbC/DsbD-like thiol-disulfide interchange protein
MPTPTLRRAATPRTSVSTGLLWLLTVAWFALPAPVAMAAVETPKLAAAIPGSGAAPGGTATLELTLTIAPLHHVYAPTSPQGLPLTLVLEEVAGVTAGQLRHPAPKVRFEPLFEGDVHEFEGAVVLQQDLDVAADAAPGRRVVRGKIVLQVCDASVCVQRELPFESSFEVAADSPVVAEPAAAAPTAATGFSFGRTATKALERATLHGVRYDAEGAGGASLVFDLEIAAAYYTYAPTTPSSFALPLAVEFAAKDVTAQGSLVHPDPEVHVDETLGETFHKLKGRFAVRQAFAVRDGGARTIVGKLVGQACDESTCQDFELPFEVDVPAAAPGGAVEASGTAGPDGPDVPDGATAAGVGAEPRESLGGFLLKAALAGLLALLMPCVFPMIPITVSVFTKQAAGKKGSALGMALVYGLAIIAAFTGIGLLAAVLLGAGAANAIGANPWLNAIFGLLFVVFGLSMLGAFEIRLPSFLVSSAAAAQSRSSGLAQIFFMAIVFAATSFTCTAPFVGTLLVTAAGGDYTFPILGMVTFSGVLALPFIGLAAAPSALGSLPAAGSWMNTAKIVLGLLEIGFALKFFSNTDLVLDLQLLTRPSYLACWVAIGAIITLYLLGRVRLGYDAGDEPVGAYRVMAAVVFGWLTLYLASGFVGTRFGDTIEGLLPPSHYGVAETSWNDAAPLVANPDAEARSGAHTTLVAGLPYYDSYAPARAAAIAAGTPLFLDFTGITCVNCRAMEERVFPLPAAREQLGRFTRVQLYVDKGAEKKWNADMQEERFGTAAQPYYVVLDPRDESVLGVYEGYASTPSMVDDFIAVLARANEAFAAKQP